MRRERSFARIDPLADQRSLRMKKVTYASCVAVVLCLGLAATAEESAPTPTP